MLEEAFDNLDETWCYLIGFIRYVPEVLTFVSPVFTREDDPQNTYIATWRDLGDMELFPVSDESQIVPVAPYRVCRKSAFASLPPIYGIEAPQGMVNFGTARALQDHYRSSGTPLGPATRETLTRVLSLTGSARYGDVFFSRPIQARAFARTPLDNSTRIVVIGVGGGGSEIVKHMQARNVRGPKFFFAATDAYVSANPGLRNVIRLGESLDFPLVATDEWGVPEMAIPEIRSALEQADMLFLTAGMGGDTGAVAAPFIARMAREMGVFTVGMMTKAFEWQGPHRRSSTEMELARLEANVDSLIVVPNEKLLGMLDTEVTREEAFSNTIEVLGNAVGAISEIINDYGGINVDFEDVRMVMGEPGRTAMGTALASGPDRAYIAAEQAISGPLLNFGDLARAGGVLILLTTSKGSLKLSEAKLAMSTVRVHATPDAHVIYGAAFDERLGGEMRITVVATGLSNLDAVSATDRNDLIWTNAWRHGTGDHLETPVPGEWKSSRKAAVRTDDLSSKEGPRDAEMPPFPLKKRE